MPIFAIFMPVSSAISATAVVHLLNNVFKLSLVYKKITWEIVFKFGIPASIFSIVGSFTLLLFSIQPNQLNKIIGFLIIFFALFEIIPKLRDFRVKKELIPIGGAVSGYFGGLSGHQGAFRSMFLLKSGLEKDSFIANSVIIAILVDLTRIFIYGIAIFNISNNLFTGQNNLIILAIVSSFLGSFIGNKFAKKITINFIKYLVSILMSIIGFLLIIGVI